MFKYLFTDKAMLGSTLGTFPNEIKSHHMWRCASQPSSLEALQEGTHLLRAAGHRKKAELHPLSLHSLPVPLRCSNKPVSSLDICLGPHGSSAQGQALPYSERQSQGLKGPCLFEDSIPLSNLSVLNTGL